MGTDPAEFLGYNPFTASIEIKLNAEYANADSIQWIEKPTMEEMYELIKANFKPEAVPKTVEEFNNKYNFKIKLTTDYPAIVMFEDGKITSLLQENDKRDFTISTVKDYLELNMIGE